MDYELFDIKGRDFPLVGYHFGCETAKKVVVLIHGVGEYDGRYQRVANQFEMNDIAMVGMDLRGHGRSGGVRGDAAPRKEILKDIDKLIEITKEMYPGLKIVLYGHSMGGGILCDYRARGAYRNEVDGYIISAPWLKLVKAFPDAAIIGLTVLSKLAPKMKVRSECEEKDLGNPQFVLPYKADKYVHPYITLRAALDGFKIGKAIAEGTNDHVLTNETRPTLLMYGSNDKICDPKGSREYKNLQYNKENPNFKAIEWPGLSHEIHNGGENGESGQEVIDTMIDFIKNI